MNVGFSLKPIHFTVLARAAGDLVAVMFGIDEKGRRSLSVLCDLVAAGYLENPRTRIKSGVYLFTATLTANGRAVSREWQVSENG